MGISGAAFVAWAGSAAGATTIATVATVAATAVSVYSSSEQAKNAKDRAAYDSRVAENNAAYQEDAAVAQADKIRKVGREQEAAANLSLAGGGVKLGEGTAVDITRQIGQNTEEDAYNTLLTGQRSKTSGDQQASLITAAGDQTAANDYIGIGTTVLGSAATVAGNWRTTSKKN